MPPRFVGLRAALLLLVALAGTAVVVYETFWNDFSSLNHYEALGVPETAQLKDIKRAFRERSLQYHPDKASVSQSAELNTKRFHRISGEETDIRCNS
uniref:J domain-containing protein n=1 Tax=Globisporangium ultimum (strain ATCC 200006 / CBS 805.95 / DAOM BR144) TaxID=431595 RepID=K3X8U7_GLOUD